ncbi:MAG: hypothetical protein IH624_08400 [Phycisphaerae bacterium]|nr:hypothetical protein [Phycisphaerae bacterium]
MRHARMTVLLIFLVTLSASSYGMYDTKTGRFLQHDPLGYKDGLSMYEYARSAPASHTDPSGTCIIIGVETCVLPRPILNPIVSPIVTPKPVVTPIPIMPPPVVVPPVTIAPPGTVPIAEPVPVPITEPIVQPITEPITQPIVHPIEIPIDNPSKTCHRPNPPKKCLPCIPPVGTLAFRIDLDHSHYPYEGSHVHYYNMNQSPPPLGCQCFWHLVGVSGGPIPWGGVPITEPAGGGIAP